MTIMQSMRNLPDSSDMSGKLLKFLAKEFDLAGQMSKEKFDIRQTFHSEMSGDNSKCPAKDKMFGEAQMNFAYYVMSDRRSTDVS